MTEGRWRITVIREPGDVTCIWYVTEAINQKKPDALNNTEWGVAVTKWGAFRKARRTIKRLNRNAQPRVWKEIV